MVIPTKLIKMLKYIKLTQNIIKELIKVKKEAPYIKRNS